MNSHRTELTAGALQAAADERKQEKGYVKLTQSLKEGATR